MPRVTPSSQERFWAKVAEQDECWVWTAFVDKSTGYGRFQLEGKSIYAHRYSYEYMIAKIPRGLQLDHLCRNRACVNPYHLEPVTSLINTKRSPLAHGNETHCPSGHPYSGPNLLVVKAASGTRRRCKACQRNARERCLVKAARTSRGILGLV